MRWSAVLGCALAAGTGLAGCQQETRGTPTMNPPSSPVSPPAAEVLAPQESGYVFIEPKSGQIHCQLDRQSVACEALFADAPLQDGVRANGVNTSADGSVAWIVGNLGDIPVVTIDYRTYSAVGWTIVATTDGTRFTNQKTKHGMFVSIEKVETF
jgi:hypothetical protein